MSYLLLHTFFTFSFCSGYSLFLMTFDVSVHRLFMEDYFDEGFFRISGKSMSDTSLSIFKDLNSSITVQIAIVVGKIVLWGCPVKDLCHRTSWYNRYEPCNQFFELSLSSFNFPLANCPIKPGKYHQPEKVSKVISNFPNNLTELIFTDERTRLRTIFVSNEIDEVFRRTASISLRN